MPPCKPVLWPAVLCAGVLDEDDAFGIMEDYVTHDDVDSYAGQCNPPSISIAQAHPFAHIS